jgi:hypothetical protein
MTTKVVSFQIAQAADRWTPDVVALCEDGSLWTIGLADFEADSKTEWRRLTPEIHQVHMNTFMRPHE